MFSAGCGRKCPLQADKQSITLGRVTDNSNVFFSFLLINTGKEAVSVKRVLTSLSGVAVQNQPGQVAAGDTVEVKLVLLANGMDGDFCARVEVETDGRKQPEPVYVAGFVEKTPLTIEERCRIPLGQLLIDKKDVGFGKISLNKVYRDTLLVYNPTDKMLGMNVISGSGAVVCRLVDPCVKPGKAAYLEVSILVKDVKRLGQFYESVLVQVGRSVINAGILTVAADVTENFENLSTEERRNAPSIRIDSVKCDFGTITAGMEVPHSFAIKNDGKRDLIIRKVQASCGCTAVIGGERIIAPGKETTVDIVYKSSGRHGVQQKSILLFCNDPVRPEVKLWVTGIVE